MAITKINSVLVKHGRIMFAVITAIIIVAFVWFFTPGTSGSIFFDRNPDSPNALAGEIFGKKLKNKEVKAAARDLTLIQAMMYGVAPKTELFNVSYDQAFTFAAVKEVALKLGITVSDAEMIDMIRKAPVFQKDGKFSPEAYVAYEKEKLQPEGFNAADLENAVRTHLTFAAMASCIGAETVSDSELNEYFKTNLETYDVLNITFRTENFKKGITPSKEDLLAYYKANPQLFMTQKKFSAEAVFFPYSRYAVTPDAKAVKSYYDAHKNEFMKDGKQQAFKDVSSAITARMKEAMQHKKAMEDAVAFREKIYQATSHIAGDKTAYLAQFHAVVGKNPLLKTGWFPADAGEIAHVGKDPVFAAAVMSLAESNVPVTDPVEGVKGVYVAALIGYTPSEKAGFEQVQKDAAQKYIEAKAETRAKEAMRTFAAKVAEAKKTTADSVKALAKNAEVTSFSGFCLFPGSDKIPAEVVMLAAATPNGKLSESVPSAKGVSAVYVIKRTAPDAKAIEANRKMLTNYYKYVKAESVSSAFYEWINKNTKNYAVRER